MMPNYATLDEATQSIPGHLIADVDDATLGRLVSHASRIVRKHTRNATYDTTDDHMPTSPTIRKTFREATIAQVNSWLENDMGVEVLSGGASAQARISSTSSNGKSISLDHSAADVARARLTRGGLGTEAELILDTMGLLGGMPGVYR